MKEIAKGTALVTGGAGFVGSHLAEELLTMGYSVIILDDLSTGFERNIPAGAKFVRGSITDVEMLERLFHEHKIDYVFHLAAYAAQGLSHFIRRNNYEVNLVGAVNVINMAVQHNVKHFVFTSSVAVYGTNRTPMTEELPPMPEDPYGVAKLSVEFDLIAAHKMFGLKYTIFRPHNIYGERQHHGDTYRNVLGIFVNQIMTNKPMCIFGDGSQSRAFTYVKDVAPYLARAIETPAAANQIINIGAEKPYTVLELAHATAKEMGVKAIIDFQPGRNEVKHAFCDHEKAKRIFGITGETDVEYGLKKMVEWGKKIGPMEPTRFEKVEVTRNMPPSWAKLLKTK